MIWYRFSRHFVQCSFDLIHRERMKPEGHKLSDKEINHFTLIFLYKKWNCTFLFIWRVIRPPKIFTELSHPVPRKRRSVWSRSQRNAPEDDAGAVCQITVFSLIIVNMPN